MHTRDRRSTRETLGRRVRKHRRVVLRRPFAFGVEPQARCDLGHPFLLRAATCRVLRPVLDRPPHRRELIGRPWPSPRWVPHPAQWRPCLDPPVHPTSTGPSLPGSSATPTAWCQPSPSSTTPVKC